MLDFRLVRHLWYFVAVAEEKHFGKAAQRLGISQPPLTQQIQILERALGVRLFERSRKGAFLTREGAAIFNSVRSLLDHAQQVERAVRNASRGASTTLVIGSIGTGLFEILPPVVKKAKQQFPQLSLSIVEMHSSNVLAALQTREIDLAFARVDDPGLEAVRIEPILTERMIVALPSDHPLARRKCIPLRELANEEFVLLPRRVSASYFDTIVAACRAAGFSPRIRYEATSIVAQMAFVGCRIAISLVPPSAIRFRAEEVVFRPLKERIAVATVAAVWNPHRCHPLVQSVVDIAAEIGRRGATVGADTTADRASLPRGAAEARAGRGRRRRGGRPIAI